jgi:transposase
MIPSQVRIFVCTERQDMRRSFDALALAVRERLALDPESGALFVFASKRGNRLKVLWFDHNGYCLLYKRLHRALFELPDATASDRPLVPIDARALASILRGVARKGSQMDLNSQFALTRDRTSIIKGE